MSASDWQAVSERLFDETYRLAGSCLHAGQMLELLYSHLLASVALSMETNFGHYNFEDVFRRAIDYKFDRYTLGKYHKDLLKFLSRVTSPTQAQDFMEYFDEAVKERNYLAHHIFADHFWEVITRVKVRMVVKRLRKMHELLWRNTNTLNILMMKLFDETKWTDAEQKSGRIPKWRSRFVFVTGDADELKSLAALDKASKKKRK